MCKLKVLNSANQSMSGCESRSEGVFAPHKKAFLRLSLRVERGLQNRQQLLQSVAVLLFLKSITFSLVLETFRSRRSLPDHSTKSLCPPRNQKEVLQREHLLLAQAQVNAQKT